MCALLRFSAGGLAVLLTTAYVAVSAESGISAFRPTVIEPAASANTLVNRVNKGDREVTILDARGPSSRTKQACDGRQGAKDFGWMRSGIQPADRIGQEQLCQPVRGVAAVESSHKKEAMPSIGMAFFNRAMNGS